MFIINNYFFIQNERSRLFHILINIIKANKTLQEKIELSWAFLTNITEQVMSRFSAQDQKKVEDANYVHTLIDKKDDKPYTIDMGDDIDKEEND